MYTIGKNNYKLYLEKRGEKFNHYSIKKLTIGTASVAVAASIFLGVGGVAHAEEKTVNEKVSAVTNVELEKNRLTAYIQNIQEKLENGSYKNKTEESINILKQKLKEAKNISSTATSQKEIDSAYQSLVTIVNSKLESKKEDNYRETSVKIKGNKTDKSDIQASKTNIESNSILDKSLRMGTSSFRSVNETEAKDDTHHKNEKKLNIINGNFEQGQGLQLPQGSTNIVTNDKDKVAGWKVVDPTKQTEIPIANAQKSDYGSNTSDSNAPYGAVLGGYTEKKTNQGNPGTTKVDTIGGIYQEFDVTPGSELLVKYNSSSFGAAYGFAGAKLTVSDADNLSNILYSGVPNWSGFQNFGKFDGKIINIPKTVKRIRITFEDADNYNHANTDNNKFDTKNKTKVYPGGVVSNVRVNSGSYIVSQVTKTNYEVSSSSKIAKTVEVTVTVKVENKGWESSANTIYKVKLPKGAKVLSGGTESNGELTVNVGKVESHTSKTISYKLQLPADTPIKESLEGIVNYETNGMVINQSGIKTKNQGKETVNTQIITVKMYKEELRKNLETVKNSLTGLKQSDYTKDSWNALQNTISKAEKILAETDQTPVQDQANQATINSLELQLTKDREKLDIAKILKEKEAEIEASKGTKEEKEAVKAKAKEEADKANKAIDEATTNEDVTKAKDAGVSAINNISIKSKQKDKFKKILPEKSNLNTNERTIKKLFNTGQNTDLSFSGLALGVLGMLLIAKRRKENKK
ncbi:hypothetical protein AXE85_01920 [Gemella sp. oral taxon 928]|uniref:SasC/FmtB family protein n=1 Tax=Gemella sp. oral taxon 928 TaxID=1785995 RepID=UPI0007681153|nr:SasC/FmtB family protein [Gemella sp. oral taxon 928]AME09004.1 hypothetical protein AXE85_01920 [Gemella sp. oral taxon 928]